MAQKRQPETAVTRRTVETLLKEVSEQSRNYDRALKKLLREKPGTEPYDGSLANCGPKVRCLPPRPSTPAS